MAYFNLTPLPGSRQQPSGGVSSGQGRSNKTYFNLKPLTGTGVVRKITPTPKKKTLGEKVYNVADKVTDFVGARAIADTYGAEIAKSRVPEEQKKFITQPTVKQTAASGAETLLNILLLTEGAGATKFLPTKGLGAVSPKKLSVADESLKFLEGSSKIKGLTKTLGKGNIPELVKGVNKAKNISKYAKIAAEGGAYMGGQAGLRSVQEGADVFSKETGKKTLTGLGIGAAAGPLLVGGLGAFGKGLTKPTKRATPAIEETVANIKPKSVNIDNGVGKLHGPKADDWGGYNHDFLKSKNLGGEGSFVDVGLEVNGVEKHTPEFVLDTFKKYGAEIEQTKFFPKTPEGEATIAFRMKNELSDDIMAKITTDLEQDAIPQWTNKTKATPEIKPELEGQVKRITDRAESGVLEEATFERGTHEEWTRKILQKDTQHMENVVNGIEAPIEGVPRNKYYDVLSDIYEKEGNIAKIDALAKSAPKEIYKSKTGQELSALSQMNKDSTTNILSRVYKEIRDKLPRALQNKETKEVKKFSDEIKRLWEESSGLKPTESMVAEALERIKC